MGEWKVVERGQSVSKSNRDYLLGNQSEQQRLFMAITSGGRDDFHEARLPLPSFSPEPLSRLPRLW